MSFSDNNTDHYEGALLEEIHDKIEIILEGQAAMVNVPSDIIEIKQHIETIEADIDAIKAVVKVHSGQIENHETRITKLETA